MYPLCTLGELVKKGLQQRNKGGKKEKTWHLEEHVQLRTA